MDPLGLALENFNAMGMWRESELSLPIDMAGTLITRGQINESSNSKSLLQTNAAPLGCVRCNAVSCFSGGRETGQTGRGIPPASFAERFLV